MIIQETGDFDTAFLEKEAKINRFLHSEKIHGFRYWQRISFTAISELSTKRKNIESLHFRSRFRSAFLLRA